MNWNTWHKSLLSILKHTEHVRIMTDKTTAVTYIDKKGGTQSVSCNNMTKEIWTVFQKHQFHLSV